MRHILIIAGSDSSCGAGIARDLAVTTEIGAMPRLCITAVTAQDANGVRASHPVPPDTIAAQISAAGPVQAVKIGMLSNAETVRAVTDAMANALPHCPTVLDPVLMASAGGVLLDGDGQAALRALFPNITLITPNLPEAAALTGHDEIGAQGKALLDLGANAALIKGGHARGRQATDWLFRPGQPAQPFTTPRHPTDRRGTGCTLSTAIACMLADGMALPDAVSRAKDYLDDWLKNGAGRGT